MLADIGCAANDATTPLAPCEFDRDPVGAHDVRIGHCGVCRYMTHNAMLRPKQEA